MNTKFARKAVALFLALAIVFLLIPSYETEIKAAEYDSEKKNYIFESGDVAVITQALIDKIAAENQDEAFKINPVFIIEDGVYSVTVQGEIEVSIIFGVYNESEDKYQGVTIDRRADTYNANLYQAGKDLEWYYNGTNDSNGVYVPTVPFLITGGATAHALFLGDCTFYAGANQVYLDSENDTALNTGNNRGGYAGIQVDGTSSLKIIDVTNGELKAYGAYQLAGSKIGNHTYDSDPLKVNPINDTQYGQYVYPDGTTDGVNSGGAGIGGGATYNQTTIRDGNYTAGTPGEILIQSGKIYAVGGHLSAGIGGGLNSAATTSKIQIDNGEITAIGGRFATGIGDGDSTNNYASPCYGEEYEIIINGGNIKAYGGTAAAAIGTTDKISVNTEGLGASAYSGLTITINGGMIEAQSGEATGAESYTAAIGAGERTNMKNNSITIHSDATVFARSFSNYAISNNGVPSQNTNADVPMVNIDPDGFMYLARFSKDDQQARQMTLYTVFTDILGNPIVIEAEAYEIYNKTKPSADQKYYAKTSDDEGNVLLYEVQKNGDVFIPTSPVDNLEYYTNTRTENFSYYYDLNHSRHFDVPVNYKAVALTLKRGDYVFHVPTGRDNDTSNDTFCHFNKELTGTTSVAVIEVNTNDWKKYHLEYFNSADNIHANEFPNVKEDAIATGFTTITVQSNGTYYLTEENFQPTVLGYTVYLPNGTQGFTLDIGYDLPTKNNQGTVTAGVREILFTYTGAESSDISNNGKISGDQLVGANRFDFQFNGSERADIWIHKTDTVGGNQVYITYKVTVICKPQYYIHLNDLSKKYDGLQVVPEIEYVTENKGDTIEYSTEHHEAEYGEYSAEIIKTGSIKTQTKTYSNTNVTISYEVVPNASETEMIVNVSFSYRFTTRRVKININYEGDTPVITLDSANDTELMKSGSGTYKIVTDIISTTVKVNGQDKTIQAVKISVGYYNRNNNLNGALDPILQINPTFFAIYRDANANELPKQTANGTIVYGSYTEAYDAAVAEANAAFEKDWTLMYSETFYYATGKDKEGTMSCAVIPLVNKPNNTTAEYTYIMKHNHFYMYEAFHFKAEKETTGATIAFADAQKTQVEVVYYKDPDGDGILKDEDWANGFSEAPKDAGDYIIIANYEGPTFEAHAREAFEIRKRPIQIIAVENWLTYLDEATIKHLQESEAVGFAKTYPLNPTVDRYDHGKVIFDDVIEGDTVLLNPKVYSYYNEITISHNPTKITLRYDAEKNDQGQVIEGYQANWLQNVSEENDNHNYELINVKNYAIDTDSKAIELLFSYVHIPGTLAYVSEGTIFKKTDSDTSVWRKFWPAWDDTFLKWNREQDADGNYLHLDELGNFTEPADGETRIDHNSPSNASHQDYIYLQTFNADRVPTYSIDIEYGSMNFTYAKAVWDVNRYTYIETPESFWSGNDGVNNLIRITNRSDSEVTYTAELEKDSFLGVFLEVSLSPTPVAEGDGFGTEHTETLDSAAINNAPVISEFYLIVKGKPINSQKAEVGSITLTVMPTVSPDTGTEDELLPEETP